MRIVRSTSAALLSLATLLLAVPTASAGQTLGQVRSQDHTLRSGCHPYRYHYDVRPPTADWQLTTWLYDRSGHRRGYDYLQPSADPSRGRAEFILCRPQAKPGRYTIKARLRWYDDPLLPLLPATRHSVWLAPAHLRLRRP
ncbi:MAG: hypothetical protein QM747_14060 [Nocardioides sp.]